MKSMKLLIKFHPDKKKSVVSANPESRVNSQDPRKQELDRLIKKSKKKTEADEKRILDLTWLLGLYHDNGQPILPGKWVFAGIRGAAKKERQGKQVQIGIEEPEDVLIILREKDKGKTIEQLMNDPDYRWTRFVNRGVVACDPVFPGASAEVEVKFDPTKISETSLRNYVKEMRIGASTNLGKGQVEVEIL